MIGVEVLVDGSVGFLNLGVGGTLEVHVQVPGQIPAQLKLSVPQELLAESERQLIILGRFHVALLQLIVVTGDFRVESYALWQPVETEALEDIPVLRF